MQVDRYGMIASSKQDDTTKQDAKVPSIKVSIDAIDRACVIVPLASLRIIRYLIFWFHYILPLLYITHIAKKTKFSRLRIGGSGFRSTNKTARRSLKMLED
jgi:hypothetical protein